MSLSRQPCGCPQRPEGGPAASPFGGLVPEADIRLSVTNGDVHIARDHLCPNPLSDGSGELRSHCRHGLKYRRHIRLRRKTKVRNIPDRVSIHDRPPEADGRRFGDWEMDLIVGKGGRSAILTMCERSRNYLLMRRLPHGKSPEGVAEAAISLLLPYRKNVRTITTDNGSEIRDHRKIAEKLNATVYFADSYAP